MLYSLHYYLDGISGEGGAIDTNRAAIVDHAASLAKVAVDMLGDWVTVLEWYDAKGEPTDVESLFKTNDEDELEHAVSEVSEAMKGQRLGYIDIHEHDDLFALIKHHRVAEWVQEPLRERIAATKRAYFHLMTDISDEWDAT